MGIFRGTDINTKNNNTRAELSRSLGKIPRQWSNLIILLWAWTNKTVDGARPLRVHFFFLAVFFFFFWIILPLKSMVAHGLKVAHRPPCLICGDRQRSIGKRSVAHRKQPLRTFLLALVVSSGRGEAVVIPTRDSQRQNKNKIGSCVHKQNSCHMFSPVPQLRL